MLSVGVWVCVCARALAVRACVWGGGGGGVCAVIVSQCELCSIKLENSVCMQSFLLPPSPLLPSPFHLPTLKKGSRRDSSVT